MGKHKHPEAFMLMEYVSEDGSEREVLWNSRDGVTPFIVQSATSGAPLRHTHRSADRYAPGHEPKVGDRIFVDLTQQRARVRAARTVERMLAVPEGRAVLEASYSSREEAVERIAADELQRNDGGSPDILVVTAGYLHDLAAKRAMQPGVILGVDLGFASITKVSVVTHTPGAEADGERSFFFDRQRRPIDARRFEELFMDESYRRVALTVVLPENGDHVAVLASGEGWFVTTVWLGTNHNFFDDPRGPIVFETMTWRDGQWGDQYRYFTEEEALAGHNAVVAQELVALDELARKKKN